MDNAHDMYYGSVWFFDGKTVSIGISSPIFNTKEMAKAWITAKSEGKRVIRATISSNLDYLGWTESGA